MSEPDRPIRPDNQAEARRWLVIVEEDIDVAAVAARLSRLEGKRSQPTGRVNHGLEK
jgi:hypothetical protein